MITNTKKKAATQVPQGVFCVSIDELRRQVKKGRIEAGPQGLQPRRRFSDNKATKVPKGTFHVSIDELRRQVKKGRIEAGPQGLKERRRFFNRKATKVPKGTFHQNPIAKFERDAPNAEYMGRGEDGDVWVEDVTDPVTGIAMTLAYTTNDGGRTAKAWCIDPDMKGHNESVHACHCYTSGEICTDLHGVHRSLPEKRARAVLWVTGFANYLREGRFRLDE